MTTTVTVILPSALVEHAGGKHTLDVTLGRGTTVSDLLDNLAVDHPGVARRVRDETGAVRRHVNVFIDGDECRALGGADAHVSGGAIVHIIPAVSGG